jgi:2-keto-4-pentenoate hydratase/2-oxohepta-3-ene-1,7-dioic acid hydratase in catechol pathway
MIVSVGGRDYPPGRVFCIGRNDAAHARELQNEAPAAPVVFQKSPLCLAPPGVPIHYPAHGRDLQHEVEVVVLLGGAGRPRTEAEARALVAGLTLGLDLTLRDVQAELKAKGLPWEAAKSFEQSAPLGPFVPCAPTLDLGALPFACRVNGAVRQQGNTRDLLFSIPALIVALARVWYLRAGDLIYTGTPQGVGPLNPGDRVTVEAPWVGPFTWEIVAAAE